MTTPDWLERTSLLLGQEWNRTVDVVGCRPGAAEQYQPSVVRPAFDGRRGKSPRVGAAF